MDVLGLTDSLHDPVSSNQLGSATLGEEFVRGLSRDMMLASTSTLGSSW